MITLAAVAASVALSNQLYIFGGCLSQTRGEGATPNAWEFEPVADSWEIPSRTQ